MIAAGDLDELTTAASGAGPAALSRRRRRPIPTVTIGRAWQDLLGDDAAPPGEPAGGGDALPDTAAASPPCRAR